MKQEELQEVMRADIKKNFERKYDGAEPVLTKAAPTAVPDTRHKTCAQDASAGDEKCQDINGGESSELDGYSEGCEQHESIETPPKEVLPDIFTNENGLTTSDIGTKERRYPFREKKRLSRYTGYDCRILHPKLF
ncbi:hypothetical protein LOD99_10976 [Oopsacas minuta]|uniref:Uncharacterized protein n=1 Tax=Oopsacas minuta TaxID=111878 RepID=A0AAV7KB15_9METZ|nr:hypothetical protein LOD99_10976 [Oopsacas minuta]